MNEVNIERVAELADRTRRLASEVERARDELWNEIRRVHDQGASIAAIQRASGYSRARVRQVLGIWPSPPGQGVEK